MAIAAGPRAARAEAADTASDQAQEDDGATQAQGSDDAADAGKSRRHKRGNKRSRRHPPLMSGRVVPDEALRKEPPPRPSGNLHLISANNRKDETEVNIYNDDGSYDLEALAEVNRVLRCRRTDAEKPIEPRLLTLLSAVYDHFGDKPLEIVSGYRNQRKKTSNHYKGTASDIRIAGVNIKKIRAFAETLDSGGMGIGIYPRSQFVHIDVRPLPSYRWIDFSPPNPDAPEKRPPRGWKRKKLQS